MTDREPLSEEDEAELAYIISEWAKSLLASYCVDVGGAAIIVELNDVALRVATVKVMITQIKVIHIRNIRWNGNHEVWKFDCPFLL